MCIYYQQGPSLCIQPCAHSRLPSWRSGFRRRKEKHWRKSSTPSDDHDHGTCLLILYPLFQHPFLFILKLLGWRWCLILCKRIDVCKSWFSCLFMNTKCCWLEMSVVKQSWMFTYLLLIYVDIFFINKLQMIIITYAFSDSAFTFTITNISSFFKVGERIGHLLQYINLCCIEYQMWVKVNLVYDDYLGVQFSSWGVRTIWG